ncbi:hypothetical protein BD324DRAFT_631497 [Kockovaella imperatae]|uniref:GRF-type domain-containing protein n=1 Tax=Kockovaella imperatae TaxID=4999 RepID=A0A1Y1UDY3_9TREE|nr:hypothetical protein BD324DRAFT_631497 [Kockovaella imperatae]ORX35747.1 hypothetical protein BD324DRAFT_631497 [Kockovaella imperatae]
MSRVTTRVNTRTRNEQDDDEEVPKCSGHQRLAKQFVAGPTAKNPGRSFYACPLSRNDPQRCKFFQWADESEKTTVATPGEGHRLGGRQLQTPPQTHEIDWSKVDTDKLEREASASQSSQQAVNTTPLNERLSSLAKRKTDDEDVTPVKRIHLDPQSPFVTSPMHPALSPSTHHLEEVSEHLHRQDRLIKAGQAAKEGLRSQINRLKDRNAELEARVKQLESQIEQMRRG